jgi:hypothetical protein
MVTGRDLPLLDLWGWGVKIERRKIFQILYIGHAVA